MHPPKSKLALAALFAFTALASGCAGTGVNPNEPVAYEDREYVTGSNLPVKKRRPATDEERERAQETARVMREEQARSGTLTPSPGRM